MPLLKEENIHSQARWALWHITEMEEELLSGHPFSSPEQEELNRIKVPERRLEWIASRILLKKLAAEQGFAQAAVEKDAFGKPFITDCPYHISLSHAFPYAAAIIHEQPVGIDVEHSREQLFRIRHKFLHPEELSRAGNDLQMLGIYWSAKEALYKLYGRKGLLFQEQIRIEPFEYQQEGRLQGWLLTKSVKERYILHYHHFRDLLVCFTL
jgi:4'-phosphopantetheinyl transferase